MPKKKPKRKGWLPEATGGDIQKGYIPKVGDVVRHPTFPEEHIYMVTSSSDFILGGEASIFNMVSGAYYEREPFANFEGYERVEVPFPMGGFAFIVDKILGPCGVEDQIHRVQSDIRNYP